MDFSPDRFGSGVGIILITSHLYSIPKARTAIYSRSSFMEYLDLSPILENERGLQLHLNSGLTGQIRNGMK